MKKMLKFWTRGCRTTLLPIDKKLTATKLWQKSYWKEIKINWANSKRYSFISLIFLQAFHFQSRFPVPALPPCYFFGLLPFPNFFTLFYLFRHIFSLLFLVKKNRCQIKSFWVDVKYFGYHTVRSCEDGFEKVVGVTREIVQPAKASNFSENRLLKRASPHDTETIYQLFLFSLMYHYSFGFGRQVSFG